MIVIYTVGHSNHSTERFITLLKEQGIELLVDVRSSPYSRYVPHANREPLARALQGSGIDYHWLGDRLGGKPSGIAPDVQALRAGSAFQQGVSDLLTQAAARRTAIMCAEGDHRQCHRHKLIAPELLDRGARILHIQPDGSTIDEDREPKQLRLF